MRKNRAGWISELDLLALCVLNCVGVRLWYHACGTKDDGSFMSCHWAQQSVFAVSVVLAVLAVIALIFRSSKVEAGLLIAMVPLSVLTAIIPQTVINLCMMPDMHCRAVMQPCVIAAGAIIAIAALVAAILRLKAEKA